MNDKTLTDKDHNNININILLNLLDPLKGSKTRIIYSGSVAKYEQKKIITENTQIIPQTLMVCQSFWYQN